MPKELGMPYSLDDVEALEAAVVAQWANFGQGPGGAFHDDGERAWTEASTSRLRYNAIVRTRLRRDAEDRIDAMVRHFRTRGAQLLNPANRSLRSASK